MLKYLTGFLLALGLFVTMAATAAFAQSGSVLEVNIPFPFKIYQTTLPAGEYTVQTLSQVNGGLLIRSIGGRSVMTFVTTSVQAKSRSVKGSLAFHRYGDEYFLSQVWAPGNAIGRELTKSRRELELAKNMEKAPPSSPIVVAHEPRPLNRTKGK